MDRLIVNGDIVTMDAERRVLLGGAVAVSGERITAVGSTSRLREEWPTAAIVDARGGVVTPGLIDAHQHLTGDPLVRCCIPDDLEPGRSIFDWSVPLHTHHDGDDDELSALASAAEALTNGVTTVVEAGTVAHPDRVAAGLRQAGIRATIGTWGWDTEGLPFSAPPDESLDRQRAVLDAYPPGGTITGWVTLVGHNLVSDELLAGAADLARRHGVGMTMHLSPTSSDPECYLRATGRRPVSHLGSLGVLGPHLLIGHGVWLDDEEVEAVLASETALAYCPWAYLRLGQGVAARSRHAEIHRRGGRVALGCDASNAGDQIDILRTAALAAGLAKDAPVDPTAFSAHDALEMATIGGARAIGMGEQIGSIEVGKQADLVIHDPDSWVWSPRGDVALQLVWGTDGRSVDQVIVAGHTVVADGEVVSVDKAATRAELADRQRGLLRRAGIEVPHRWPYLPSA